MCFWNPSDIPIPEFVSRVAAQFARLLGDPDADGAADRSELDGVAHDIEQYLIEAQLVRDDILIHDILSINKQILLLRSDAGLDDRSKVMQDIRQMHFIFIDFDLAAFYTAHVENVIDKAQQMIAGC